MAVVVAVSAEVCAAVLLMETEAGERLHVGVLLTAVGPIEQLRLTVPVKPLKGVVMMETVLPVVAPGVIINDALLPLIVNVGAGLTLTAPLT